MDRLKIQPGKLYILRDTKGRVLCAKNGGTSTSREWAYMGKDPQKMVKVKFAGDPFSSPTEMYISVDTDDTDLYLFANGSTDDWEWTVWGNRSHQKPILSVRAIEINQNSFKLCYMNGNTEMYLCAGSQDWDELILMNNKTYRSNALTFSAEEFSEEPPEGSSEGSSEGFSEESSEGSSERSYDAVILDFNMQKQELDNWCWAAVTTSVSLFYNDKSQWNEKCKLVNKAFPEAKNTCCQDDSRSSKSCNRPWWTDKALRITYNLYKRELYDEESLPPDMQTIKREIDGKRPLVCSIQWKGGGAHAVVIIGYNLPDKLWIEDSYYGRIENIPLKTFTKKYRRTGSWVKSYFTQP